MWWTVSVWSSGGLPPWAPQECSSSIGSRRGSRHRCHRRPCCLVVTSRAVPSLYTSMHACIHGGDDDGDEEEEEGDMRGRKICR